MTTSLPTDTREALARRFTGEAVEVSVPGSRTGLLVMRNLLTSGEYAWLMNRLGVAREEDGLYIYVNTKNPALPVFYDEDAGGYAVRPGRADHPVVGVPWGGASLVAGALGGRLLTEQEWEHCALAGDPTRLYPWGNSAPDPELANYAENVGATTRVGQYPPNDFGFRDVAGNAEEWCHDWFAADASTTDSVPPLEKVVKGGGWNKSPELLRSRQRRGRWYLTGSASISFRIAWEIS